MMVVTKLQQTAEKSPEINGMYMITMTWQPESEDDIDIWVQDPENSILCFVNKTVGFMALDRDDYGHRGDTDTDGNLAYNENREVVMIRKVIHGEYTVNVHFYTQPSAVVQNNITVRLEKISPYAQIAMKTLTMSTKGDEQTAFRFFVDENGIISSVYDTPKQLVGIPK
jgi:hypothetical protein